MKQELELHQLNTVLDLRDLDIEQLAQIEALTGYKTFGDFSSPMLFLHKNGYCTVPPRFLSTLQLNEVDFEIFMDIHFGI